MTASSTEQFFGFSHRPFRCTPDAQDYVALESVEQEIERLVASAVQGDGVSVLTAPPGAGKTVVCERLQQNLSCDFQTAVLTSSGFATRRALLQAMLFALGQPYEDLSEQELRLAVLNFGRSVVAEHQGIALIVDEAHLLNTRLLEELRCLTNHSEAGRPLIRVILSGQLPLEDALVDPALQALNYRITCHATLEPLTMQESAELVTGRLRHAGRDVESILTPEALETICRVSDGNPRCLVQLSDQALSIGATRAESPVTVESVRLALRDLKQLPLHWNESAVDQPAPVTDGCEREPVDGGLSDEFEFDAETSIDVAENLLEEQVPPTAIDDWSAAVSSVEVGSGTTTAGSHDALGDESDTTADVEIGTKDAPPTTAGWSSFEPESSTQPTSTDRQSDEALSVDDAPANGVSDIGSAEVTVDDVYAALDHSTARTGELPETAELLALLDSTVRACRPHPKSATPDAASTVTDETAPHERAELPAAAQALRSPNADPDQRIDEILSALSLVTDGPEDVADNEPMGDDSPFNSEWQTAGDEYRFDLIEPGGDPIWNEEPVLEAGPAPREPLVESPALSTSPTSVETRDVHRHDMAHADHGTGSESRARPYARLFSRLRRQRA